jgi:hypothetical protein
VAWEQKAALVARVFVTAIVAGSVFLFVAFMTLGVLATLGPGALKVMERYWQIIKITDFVFSSACAVVAALTVWKGSAGLKVSGLVESAFVGAIVLGALGFAGGFIGPMIHADPRAANVGPLLGLFFTGPAGAVVGAVCGGAYWLLRRNSSRR